MLPPRTIRARRRGRPNTTKLLADWIAGDDYDHAHEALRRAMAKPGSIEILRRERAYQSPAATFDWLNALGVLIVLVLLAGGLFYFLRLCGLL